MAFIATAPKPTTQRRLLSHRLSDRALYWNGWSMEWCPVLLLGQNNVLTWVVARSEADRKCDIYLCGFQKSIWHLYCHWPSPSFGWGISLPNCTTCISHGSYLRVWALPYSHASSVKLFVRLNWLTIDSRYLLCPVHSISCILQNKTNNRSSNIKFCVIS